MTTPYVPPAAKVQQEFAPGTSGIILPQNLCILGAQKRVFDPTNATDLLSINYGAYIPGADTTYGYGGLPVGAVVEQKSVSLIFQNILAQYAELSGAGVIQRGAAANQINIPTGLGFQAYVNGGTTYARNAAFKNRDVQIGDNVQVVAGGITLKSRITGFINDTVAASVGAPVATSNPATQAYSGAAANTTVQGTDHLATISTTTTSFVGSLAKGYINDVYVLTCTLGGAPGVATFKATSTQGDNVASITSVAFGTEFAVGTCGLKAKIASAGNQAFVAGEVYTFTVAAAYAQLAPALTSSASSYAGAFSTVYKITVVKGGLWASNPQVMVTTNTGIDNSGPTVVSNYNVSFPVGQLGVSVKWATNPTQAGLVLGDVYYVTATAATNGAVRTALLANPIDASITQGTNLDVSFYIAKSQMTIPTLGYPAFGSQALTASAANFTVKAGIQILDSSWTDVDGVTPLALSVSSATVIAPYTALVVTNANQLLSLSDPDSVSAVLGATIQSNPLSYGVWTALLNSGGQPVYFVPVASDDLAGFQAALAELDANPTPYFRLVLSHDPTILTSLAGAVENQASDEVGNRCVGLVAPEVASVVTKYSQKPNGDNWAGYVAATPGVYPTQYGFVTLPGATFLTDGIRAGDEFRTSYTVDAFGNQLYKSAIIAQVVDEQDLILASPAFAAAVGDSTHLQRVQIVRTLSLGEQAAAIAATSEAFASRRVYCIFPNLPLSGHPSFVACAVAGLASSVVPHQPITNFVLNLPADLLLGATKRFNQIQLNTMAAGGTLIVTQNAPGGAAYIRHQLSTDNSDDLHSELSITRNLDSISDYLLQGVDVFIGKYNISDNFLQLLDVQMRQKMDNLVTQTSTPSAGPQVVSWDPKTLKIVQNPTSRTKVNIGVGAQLPMPANNIDIALLATA